MPNRRLRECQDCGLIQHVPALPVGGVAECRRCDAVLSRRHTDSLERALALSVAAACLFALASCLPFLAVSLAGQGYQTTLFTGPTRLTDDGLVPLAAVVLACTVLAPAAKLTVMLTVLIGLRVAEPPRWLPRAFAWLRRLNPWSMVEVFLIGVFVAYTRLQVIARVEVGPALYALGGVMLLMVAADAVLDEDEVWAAMERRGLIHDRDAAGRAPRIGCDVCGLVCNEAAGAPCPSCGMRLHVRHPASLPRATAMLVAAAILYIPANAFPVLTLIRLGRGQPSTILGGVDELIKAHMWPLAALVFVASITVPMVKLVSLALMLVATRLGSARRLRDRTRLYRIINTIGRWSMIDVFMISILVALVHMGLLADVTPGIGAVCFAAVVILTMLATEAFDPRLMWDAAERGGNDLEAECPLAPRAARTVLSAPTRPAPAALERPARAGLAP